MQRVRKSVRTTDVRSRRATDADVYCATQTAGTRVCVCIYIYIYLIRRCAREYASVVRVSGDVSVDLLRARPGVGKTDKNRKIYIVYILFPSVFRENAILPHTVNSSCAQPTCIYNERCNRYTVFALAYAGSGAEVRLKFSRTKPLLENLDHSYN